MFYLLLLSSLTGILRYLSRSNLMGGVPTQSRSQRAVSICHYAILSYCLFHYPISVSFPSTSASPPFLNLIHAYSQHRGSTGDPFLYSSATAMSKIGPVDIYWYTVICQRLTQMPIVSISTSSIASLIGGIPIIRSTAAKES